MERREWPVGIVELDTILSSSPYCDTYLVEDRTEEAIVELEAKIQRANKALDKLKDEVAEIEQEITAETYEDELCTEEEEWMARKAQARRMVAEGDGANLEKKRALLTQVETKVESLENDLKSLKETSIVNNWDFGRQIPSQFVRLDGVVRSEDSEEDEVEERHIVRKYVVKLYTPENSIDTGRRKVFDIKSRGDAQGCSPLLIEGEELLKLQWRVILMRSKEPDVMDFANEIKGEIAATPATKTTKGNKNNTGPIQFYEAAGILPIVKTSLVESKLSNDQSRWATGFFSPYCKNGSIDQGIKRIAGSRSAYWFDDRLILGNLQRTIITMARFESKEIFHGNIKPNNVCISDNGYCLLLSEFTPEVSFRRWILDLSRRLTATPAYAAPELIHAVMKKQIRSLPKLKSTINLYKADVFSLGLVYWYIIMRIEPTNFNQDPKLLAKGMSQLAQSTNRDRQLVDLIIRMTEYDPSKRPSFWELLTTAERWHARADNVLSAVKGIFGFTG